MAIDICLDAGNVYDYATNTCRSDIATSMHIPYSIRYFWELLFLTVIIAAGITLVIKSKKG